MATPVPRSRAARAVDIVLRTAHLGAMAALFGGVLFGVPAASLGPWLTLTLASGAALLVSELSHSRHWAYQGRGLLALAHVGALALLSTGGLSRAGVAAALVIGAVGSHLPKSLRCWSLRHRRVVD